MNEKVSALEDEPRHVHRRLTMTYFENERTSVASREETIPWPEAKNRQYKRVIRRSKSGLAYSPAKFQSGAKRCNDAIEWVDLLVADLDIDAPDGERIMRELLASVGDYEWCAHTTYSHDPRNGKYRGRILFPSTRPIRRDEYAQVRRGLTALLRGRVDEQTHDPARLYFSPSCPPETASEAWWEEHEGAWLDPDHLKSLAILAPRSATPQVFTLPGDPSDLSTRPKSAPPETAAEVARARSMLAAIDPDVIGARDGKNRLPWRNIVWAVLSTGWSCAETLAREWSQRGTKYDEREFAKVVRSYEPNKLDRVNYGTMVYWAKAAGWKDATPRSVNRAGARGATWQLAADCDPRPIRWLWAGKIARGKLSLVAGPAGLGKSQLCASLAAVVTTGGQWPVDRSRCAIGSVVILSAEDDTADTLVPRHMAAGADLKRVHILRAIVEHTTSSERQRTFDLTRDLSVLEEKLVAVGDVALIVIDPVSAYLGAADSHDNAQVRGVLAPLADLAARHEVAVVAVSHLNKSTGTDAQARVIGSVAFTAAARACFLVGRDPADEQRRLFLSIKNNLGTDRGGLAYRIEQVTLPSRHGDIVTSRVVWEPGPVTDVDAAEVLAPAEDRTDVKAGERLLEDLLANGPMSAKQCYEEAAAQRISARTLQRAASRLGVSKLKTGMQQGWVWSLGRDQAREPAPVRQVAGAGDEGTAAPGTAQGTSAGRAAEGEGGPKMTEGVIPKKLSSSYTSCRLRESVSPSKATGTPEGVKTTTVRGVSASVSPSRAEPVNELEHALAEVLRAPAPFHVPEHIRQLPDWQAASEAQRRAVTREVTAGG